MKRKVLLFSISVLLIGFIFTSCDKDEYLDWKYLNQNWLEQHKSEEGWITESNGVQYKVEIPGILGTSPSDVSYVTLIRTGWYINGERFKNDTVFDHMANLEPGVRQVLKKMKVNSRYNIRVPYEQAYGKDGYGDTPPYTTLIYQIELRSFFNVTQ